MGEKMWMVRAGEGAYLIKDFDNKSVFTVGREELRDSSGKNLKKQESIKLVDRSLINISYITP